MGKGKTFGDIALIHNTKRTASIMASDITDLVVLDKDVFQTYIKVDTRKNMDKNLNKIASFLEDLNMFTLISQSLIVQISAKCRIKKYPSNTIIIKQGSTAQPAQLPFPPSRGPSLSLSLSLSRYRISQKGR